MIHFRSNRLPVARAWLAVVTCAVLIFGSAARSSAATTFYTCKSVDIHSFAERIHVRCDQPTGGGIVFFAAATANSAHAARILSVLMMAHLTGRTLVVEYDPNDTSGTAFGCQAHDCRRLLSVGVL
jgi:UDP-N-acetylmuramyl pentapeptide phosphotransferase/UDP-N-acetylglucosamine-1-phosphate transferase